MNELSSILGCQIGTLPLSYLGLPLSLTKPKIEDFFPLLKRIENRLQGCSTLLNYGDKLVLIKSVFSSMPSFVMSTLSLPKAVIQQINKYLKNCFWRKYGTEERGPALIS